jgi:succinoglycan biosynthesis transport protein ExoP
LNLNEMFSAVPLDKMEASLSTAQMPRTFPTRHGLQSSKMLGEIDLVAQLRLFWRRRFLIVSAAGFVVAAVGGYVSLASPIYTAEALVLILPNAPLVAQLASVAAPLSAEQPAVDSQLQLIRSPEVAEKVVTQLRLDRDPEFNPKLRGSPSLRDQVASLVSPSEIVSLLHEWGLWGDHADADQTIGVNGTDETTGRVVSEFQSHFSASFKGGRTFVVAVQFSSKDPMKAAMIANTIADTYLAGRIEAKVAAARRASGSISGELEALRKKVVDTESAAERFSQSEGLATYRGIKVNEQQLSDVNAQLSVARVEEARAAARLEQARTTLINPSREAANPEVLNSGLISGLRQEEARVMREKADLDVTLGEKHPRLQRLDASLRNLQATIRGEIRKIVGNLVSELELARGRRAELEQTLEKLQNKGTTVADKEVRLRELEREAAASRSLYTTLLTRALETRAQQTLQLADAEVASQAMVPLEPSFPRSGRLLPLAAIAGLVLGAAVVWLLERIRTGLASKEEVERVIGLPVIMALQKVRHRHSSRGLISDLAFRLHESMRPLEVAVGQDGAGKLVLVTSALSKEGRSATASALAVRIARSGRTCLLLDCDLRRSIARKLGSAEGQPGLMQLLAGERSLSEVIYAHEEPGLDIIPSGAAWSLATDRAQFARPEDRVAAILSSEAMSILFRGLAARYDMVVVDSPPVIGSPDALILSTHVDQTVFVVRWASTSRRAALSAVQELEAAGAHMPGIVLAQAPGKNGGSVHELELAPAGGFFGYY